MYMKWNLIPDFETIITNYLSNTWVNINVIWITSIIIMNIFCWTKKYWKDTGSIPEMELNIKHATWNVFMMQL